jgi:hypothetical protein
MNMLYKNNIALSFLKGRSYQELKIKDGHELGGGH